MRTDSASSGAISGSGFAMAKTIGSFAISFTIACVSAPFTDTPAKTSAPTIASASVRAFVSRANGCLYGFIPAVRPAYTTPFVSTSVRFSFLTPSVR